MNETFEEFINEWNKTDLDRPYTPTHGRSSKIHGKKAISLLNKQNFLNANILIVTHGGTIGKCDTKEGCDLITTAVKLRLLSRERENLKERYKTLDTEKSYLLMTRDSCRI